MNIFHRHQHRWRSLTVLGGSGLFAALAAVGADLHPIATAENVVMHPGLELSLFAREPDVVDPVALCFDEDGRMFVVEMRDYPYGMGADRKPGGTIRLLEDRDGDGRADQSVVFAEDLSFPTSIAPWDGGVIVTAPPEVIFLKDTDGDGKADVREVLLKGFKLGVTDSNVNGLRWGLDNRLHGVNGGNGGSILSTRMPGPAVPLRDLDFSFDPRTGDFAATYQSSGGFGLVFDEWGRSFVTYNINHLQQRIIPAHYLSRFRGFPPTEATVSISDHGEMARIYPVAKPETRVNHPEQSGHFSSAGGMGYLGLPGFPNDLSGSVFVCDVVGNLVHRDVLQANGPVFSATRSPAEQTREFFASRDNAFRPVGVEPGPDGALYLIDMQRDVIEHPDYIPEKVRQKIDLRAGENRGRIYRIVPKGMKTVRRPGIRQASTPELVKLLSDPNQWQRLTAQRRIVAGQDRRAAAPLRRLIVDGEPLGRLHALWTLQGLRALAESDVVHALADGNPGIRENALSLAEAFLPGTVRLRRAVVERANDSDGHVRFQAALTLGQIDTPESAAALQALFARDDSSRWTRLAVLSSLRQGEAEWLRTLLSNAPPAGESTASPGERLREVADLAGARVMDDDRLEHLLLLIDGKGVTEPLRIASLEGIHSGLSRSGFKGTPGSGLKSIIGKLEHNASPGLLAILWKISKLTGLPESDGQRTAVSAAMDRLQDSRRRVEDQIGDIQLLALRTDATTGGALCLMLEGTQATSVQASAIEALRQFRQPGLATNLVRRWRFLAPAARAPVVDLLLRRPAFHGPLIAALETGEIKVGELNLDLEQRRRLLRGSSPEMAARSARFFSDEEYGNRKRTVEEWMGRLPAAGNRARGRITFEKTCTPCHSLDGIGTAVGPDLGALAHRSVEDLLSNILDPNMAINPGYVSYTAETAEGDLESGILQSDSGDSVVLLQPLGRKVTLPKNRIKRLESGGLSLMPEGLEAGLSPADLRDLIAFIQERY